MVLIPSWRYVLTFVKSTTESGYVNTPQIVKVRFGTTAHIVFTFYAFVCVLVVCGSLLGESKFNENTNVLTEMCFSGRRSYCKCPHRYEHYCRILFVANRHRGVCRVRWTTRHLHL